MKAEFHTDNRLKLATKINHGLLVLGGYDRVQNTNDSAHRFTQEANFWYLCGIDEPGWTLVVDGKSAHSWLISPDIEEVHRVFDGGMSSEEAKRVSGVDSVLDTKDGQTLIRRLAKQHSVVHSISGPRHAEHFNFVLNPAQKNNWKMLERIFQHVQDCSNEIATMRAIKQPEELLMIKKAVDVSIAAFKTIYKGFKDYKNEYEIEADFAREVRYAGASGCAYDSIVAGGLNACTLHYNKNTSALRLRQMVLMDMGAQYGGYAADISRTYSKGEPTKRQRDVHAAVETAHHRIIGLLKPLLSVQEYQRSVDAVMTEALASIGLPHDDESLRKYFPHAVSHGLGIDVHDSLGGPKYFEENMVLTVEPGIYIPEENIGVRIEDDIVITKSGHRNLSANLSTGL